MCDQAGEKTWRAGIYSENDEGLSFLTACMLPLVSGEVLYQFLLLILYLRPCISVNNHYKF